MASIIIETAKVSDTIEALRKRDQRKHAKVIRCLAKLSRDPTHPGLNSHPYQTIKNMSTAQETIWESYVENNSPSAWRMWWFYVPESGEITVVDLGPHP